MARQGFCLSDGELRRIVVLLTSTDMTMKQIAQRMRCSASTVASINRKRKIRDYGGRRASWAELKATYI